MRDFVGSVLCWHTVILDLLHTITNIIERLVLADVQFKFTAVVIRLPYSGRLCSRSFVLVGQFAKTSCIFDRLGT